MEYPKTSYVKPNYTNCKICNYRLIIKSMKISELKKCKNCKYDNRPFGWLREKQTCLCIYEEIYLYVINCDNCGKNQTDDDEKKYLLKNYF